MVIQQSLQFCLHQIWYHNLFEQEDFFHKITSSRIGIARSAFFIMIPRLIVIELRTPHELPQSPHLPRSTLPSEFTFVAHQALPLSESSVVHSTYILSLYLNGKMQFSFCTVLQAGTPKTAKLSKQVSTTMEMVITFKSKEIHILVDLLKDFFKSKDGGRPKRCKSYLWLWAIPRYLDQPGGE